MGKSQALEAVIRSPQDGEWIIGVVSQNVCGEMHVARFECLNLNDHAGGPSFSLTIVVCYSRDFECLVSFLFLLSSSFPPDFSVASKSRFFQGVFPRRQRGVCLLSSCHFYSRQSCCFGVMKVLWTWVSRELPMDTNTVEKSQLSLWRRSCPLEEFPVLQDTTCTAVHVRTCNLIAQYSRV